MESVPKLRLSKTHITTSESIVLKTEELQMELFLD